MVVIPELHRYIALLENGIIMLSTRVVHIIKDHFYGMDYRLKLVNVILY